MLFDGLIYLLLSITDKLPPCCDSKLWLQAVKNGVDGLMDGWIKNKGIKNLSL